MDYPNFDYSTLGTQEVSPLRPPRKKRSSFWNKLSSIGDALMVLSTVIAAVGRLRKKPTDRPDQE